MQNKYLILCGFLLSACTIHQENGNQWSYQAPPLFAGNRWQITQQSVTPDGNRFCAVSAGEMVVTQSAQGKTIRRQVATSSPINPGDYYRVIYGSDVHEAPNGQPWFGPSASQAIIADLMKGGTVYTEIQEQVINAAGGQYARLGNKIDLDGFGPAYEKCRKFVSSTQQ